jgi:hypothetical protein
VALARIAANPSGVIPPPRLELLCAWSGELIYIGEAVELIEV